MIHSPRWLVEKPSLTVEVSRKLNRNLNKALDIRAAVPNISSWRTDTKRINSKVEEKRKQKKKRKKLSRPDPSESNSKPAATYENCTTSTAH